MNVSACIATRGDVDMQPILDSLPAEWEVLVWSNADHVRGKETIVRRWAPNTKRWPQFGTHEYLGMTDAGPHGRFAAIQYASHPLIYVQDDDVIVSDPAEIVNEWIANCVWRPQPPDGKSEGVQNALYTSFREDGPHVVCNMPEVFRPHYPDSAMVGFGAAFHRDAPERAFQRFFDFWPRVERDDPLFLRESCRIFTTLTPRVLVDVAKEDLPYASDDTRLWKDPNHVGFREAALKMARAARDA